ncbi:MAG: hypothetical protein ABI876_11465 [Bacteroidota bacterium]
MMNEEIESNHDAEAAADTSKPKQNTTQSNSQLRIHNDWGPAEVAAQLHISPKVARRLLANGDIPARDINPNGEYRIWRTMPEYVDAYKDGYRNRPDEEEKSQEKREKLTLQVKETKKTKSSEDQHASIKITDISFNARQASLRPQAR